MRLQIFYFQCAVFALAQCIKYSLVYRLTFIYLYHSFHARSFFLLVQLTLLSHSFYPISQSSSVQHIVFMLKGECHNRPIDGTNTTTKRGNAIKQTALHFFNDRYVIRFHWCFGCIDSDFRDNSMEKWKSQQHPNTSSCVLSLPPPPVTSSFFVLIFPYFSIEWATIVQTSIARKSALPRDPFQHILTELVFRMHSLELHTFDCVCVCVCSKSDLSVI